MLVIGPRLCHYCHVLVLTEAAHKLRCTSIMPCICLELCSVPIHNLEGTGRTGHGMVCHTLYFVALLFVM